MACHVSERSVHDFRSNGSELLKILQQHISVWSDDAGRLALRKASNRTYLALMHDVDENTEGVLLVRSIATPCRSTASSIRFQQPHLDPIDMSTGSTCHALAVERKKKKKTQLAGAW